MLTQNGQTLDPHLMTGIANAGRQRSMEHDVTHLLQSIEAGDAQAAEALLPLVYGQLRRLASANLSRERPGQTLQPTALVHEAWLRLAGSGEPMQWNGRAHFFGAAAEAMRRILVEQARHKQSLKAGRDWHRQALPEEQLSLPEPPIDPIELSDALTLLAASTPRAAEIVKLRYFVGLTLREAADVLGISESTADADWAYAKSWLRIKLADGPS